MTFIDTLTTLERSLPYIGGPRKQDRSCPGCTSRALPRYEQVRTSPGACLNQTAAARNKGLPPLAFDIRERSGLVHVAGGSPPYNIAVVHISPAVAIRRLLGGHDNALRWSSEYESSGHSYLSICVLRGRSGSEITTTSPTLGDVLLPRSPAGLKGAAGTHVPIFADTATPVVRASSL
ncbi:hypothetical protein SFRURICE_004840 [Spodoptera frugiperda]|nr:hypothetical protein SFRURICE_004840 [Spodoptera frugiperda]